MTASNGLVLILCLFATLALSSCKDRTSISSQTASENQALPLDDGPLPTFETFLVTEYIDFAEYLEDPKIVATFHPEFYEGRLTQLDLTGCTKANAFASIDDATEAYFDAALIRGRIKFIESALAKIPPFQRKMWEEDIQSLKSLLPYAQECDSRMRASAENLGKNSRYRALSEALEYMRDEAFSLSEKYMRMTFEQPFYHAIVHYAAKNKIPIDERLFRKIEDVSGKSASSFASDIQSINRCRALIPSMKGQDYTENANELLAYFNCLEDIEQRRVADLRGNSFRYESRARQSVARTDYSWSRVGKARQAIKSGSGSYR